MLLEELACFGCDRSALLCYWKSWRVLGAIDQLCYATGRVGLFWVHQISSVMLLEEVACFGCDRSALLCYWKSCRVLGARDHCGRSVMLLEELACLGCIQSVWLAPDGHTWQKCV